MGPDNICKNYLLIFFLIGWGLLTGIFSPVFGHEAPLLQTKEIKISKNDLKNIVLKVKNTPLLKFTKEIEKRSGITFSVSEALEHDLLNLNAEEPDWTALILEVFKDYNQVHIWASSKNLKQVYLLDPYETSLPDNINEEPSSIEKVVKKYHNKNDIFKSSGLSEKQLRKLAGGKHRSPIPLEMFNDPKIRIFLNKNGMNSLEDLSNLRLSMKVRRNARKALSFLKRSRSK